jgi:hypothetical protein
MNDENGFSQCNKYFYCNLNNELEEMAKRFATPVVFPVGTPKKSAQLVVQIKSFGESEYVNLIMNSVMKCYQSRGFYACAQCQKLNLPQK